MAGNVEAGRFVANPQPVEIHDRGIWYSGELLGWRHTPDGRVAARVRCTIDGLRRSTWKDFTELRLPDPARPPRREPFPAGPGAPIAGATPEADRTQPHTLLAALSTRPRPPSPAVTPPPARPRPTPYRRAARQADDWSRDWPDDRAHGQRVSTV